MKKLKFIFYTLLLISSFLFPQSEQRFAEIGNLELLNGSTLFNCKIGYRTFGKLNPDSSNVVIYPTWFGGTSEHISGLIGKGKIVDSSKYFVIAIDALANGVSTSPSNSKLQSGNNFPEITIDDMVNSQYKMLKEHFGFKHIHAIIGGSMGSMQALQWIVSYPNFISKAIPYVASPRRSTYDRLIMQFRKKTIETYRELGADDKLISTMINYTTQLFVRSPEYIIENISHDDFESYIYKKIENREPSKTFTIDNHLAQLKAMISYNIYKDFNNSVAETARHIKAKVFLILGETDMLVHPAPALELADELGCKVLLLENNCGHLAPGCELQKCSNYINYFLQSNIPNCNLNNSELYPSMACGSSYSRMPELLKPIDNINEEFNSLVDTSIFTKRLYVKMIVDSLGNVKCADILLGENDYVDSVAISFVQKLKFHPAEKRFVTNSNTGGTISKHKPHKVKRRAKRKISYKKAPSEIILPLTPLKLLRSTNNDEPK